jgi:5-methylcytosine-specific restriction protein A
MPRAVPEWIGQSDDSAPSVKCKQRILDRQDRRCALTGREFTAKEKPQFDHITPLWLGGQNRESNLQAIHGEPHKQKTRQEATVRAKVEANTAKHLGLKEAPTAPIKSRGFPLSPKAAKRSEKLPLLPPRPMYARGRLWPASPNSDGGE